MTLGQRLQNLRKEAGLSQEALSEKMAVTRQTISKWELDQSTPDAAYLIQLSDLFSVTTDYLLKGQVDSQPAENEISPPKRPKRDWKKINLVLFSSGAWIAAAVCLICDYVTGLALDWSLIACAGIAVGWFVLLPLFSGRHILSVLRRITLVSLPFLAVLSFLLKNVTVITLGGSAALVALAALWLCYELFQKCQGSLLQKAGFALLLSILPVIAINHLCAFFLPEASASRPSDIFNSAITLLLALVCFGVDHVHKEKQGRNAP